MAPVLLEALRASFASTPVNLGFFISLARNPCFRSSRGLKEKFHHLASALVECLPPGFNIWPDRFAETFEIGVIDKVQKVFSDLLIGANNPFLNLRVKPHASGAHDIFAVFEIALRFGANERGSVWCLGKTKKTQENQ